MISEIVTLRYSREQSDTKILQRIMSKSSLTENVIAYIFMSISTVKRERKMRLVYSWNSSSHSGWWWCSVAWQ